MTVDLQRARAVFGRWPEQHSGFSEFEIGPIVPGGALYQAVGTAIKELDTLSPIRAAWRRVKMLSNSPDVKWHADGEPSCENVTGRRLWKACNRFRRLLGRAIKEQTLAGRSAKASQRGRQKSDPETVRMESELAEEWRRAFEAGAYKAEFAKDHGMTARDFDRLLSRVAKRKRRADKIR